MLATRMLIILLLSAALFGCETARDCHVRATAATYKLKSSGVPARTLNAIINGFPHSICIYYSEGKLMSYEHDGSTTISDVPRTFFPSAEYVARLCYFDSRISNATWQKDMLPLHMVQQ